MPSITDLFRTGKMANPRYYSEILEELEWEHHYPNADKPNLKKRSGWAKYKGRRLSPTETYLVKDAASKEPKKKPSKKKSLLKK